LETLGGSAGNGKLQVELGWQDDTYWNVHAALIEDQTITKGRGRGGSVSLAAAPDNAAQPSAAADPAVLACQEPKAAPPPLPARNTGRNGGSMFEQTFKNIDDVLWKEAGCTTELDYTEQTSWILFLKYLDDLEQSRAMEAELVGKPYIQTGTTPKTSEKKYIGTYIPFIKPGDFRNDGSLDYENEGLSKLGLTQSRLIPAGSATMVCIGATIGKAGFVERDISANQQINAVTPREGISGKFLYHQMVFDGFQNQVTANSAQATLPIINKTKWGGLALLLPPTLREQEQLVSKLDRVSVQVRRLQQTFRQKLACFAELKQSILRKAFACELTAHPEKVLPEAAE
jgi:hypothetical protein